MARKQVLVQLSDEQVAALDAVTPPDQSRSELIRRAVDLYLNAAAEGLADLRYTDAYRKIPEDLEEFAGLRDLSLGAWPGR